MERDNLQKKYKRFGLAIENGTVIWIEYSNSAFTLQRNRFAQIPNLDERMWIVVTEDNNSCCMDNN